MMAATLLAPYRFVLLGLKAESNVPTDVLKTGRRLSFGYCQPRRTSFGTITAMGEVDHKFKYEAVAIEQQPDAPMMYVLGVAADQLLEWADVPSAKADYMAGYQRVYKQDRAKAITDFLALSPRNIIPGAVIVTVDAASTSIKHKSGNIFEIEIDAIERPFQESVKRLYESFRGRLSEAEIQSVELDGRDEDEEVDDEEVDGVGIPESYLATLTAELAVAADNFDDLPANRKAAIAKYVESVTKPGMIIDGQHRVYGAKNVIDHSVVLPVVLLPGLEHAEQVFHFYVLNNKAVPLTPTELRKTISTSLTNQEIDELWERFEDAGINPEATRWTFKINTHPNSPFQGAIDFGLGGDGFLKENVAFQVVSKFVNMPRKYRLLYKTIPAFEQKDDRRLDYFFAFWNAIKEVYSEIWQRAFDEGKSNQLFMKASLIVLQEYILDSLVQYTMVRQIDGGTSPLVDLDDLQKTIRGLLSFLPESFFSTEWQVKQVDTTDGHRFLREQIDLAIKNQGKNLGNQQLFKKAKPK